MKTWALFKATMLRWWRDPTALFFTIFFPLVFLLLFGSIFGGDRDINTAVSLNNQSQSQTAQALESAIRESSFFEVEDYSDQQQAISDLKEDKFSAIITIPEDFGEPNENGLPKGDVKVEGLGSNAEYSGLIVSVVQSMLAQFNGQYQQSEPLFTASLQTVSGEGLSSLDFMIPGILSISVLTISLFGMASGFTEDKKTGALERLRSAPITTYQVVVATGMAYLLMGVITLVVLLVVAKVVYDWSLVGSLFSFLAFGLLALFAMFGIGLCIGGWAKNERQAIPIAQLIGMPMMFLSGAFFPKSIMPDWLISVSRYLPLTHVADGFRLIGIEGYGFFDIGKQIAVMLLVAALSYPVALKVFRWR